MMIRKLVPYIVILYHMRFPAFAQKKMKYKVVFLLFFTLSETNSKIKFG